MHELRISSVTTAAMALFRITNSIPTADQIRRIYEEEKVLFQENAACAFFGTSDVVTALAHDPDTGLLHVGGPVSVQEPAPGGEHDGPRRRGHRGRGRHGRRRMTGKGRR
ncbi:hypothetical protein HGG71_13960 [Rhodobacteraceae bacterium R_SAG2]|nr:hypothetical protein [Rhodobacteraceae bacterium R_SAG2]